MSIQKSSTKGAVVKEGRQQKYSSYNGFAMIRLISHQEPMVKHILKKIEQIFKKYSWTSPRGIVTLYQCSGLWVQGVCHNCPNINYNLIVFEKQEHLQSRLQLPIGSFYSSLMSSCSHLVFLSSR